MNYALIYDIILVAIILTSAFIMSGKGLFKILYKIASIAVTIVVVTTCSSETENIISSSFIGDKISEKVEAYIVADNSTPEAYDISQMPGYISETVTDIKTNAVAPVITGIIISLISAVCLYLLVKLLLYILFFFIKGLFKLPVLKQVNRLVGVCVGIVSGLIFVYIACAVISLNIANCDDIRSIIDNTYLVKYFYDNNLLMSLFI